MPPQPQDERQDRHQGRKGCEKDTDLGRLARCNDIGGQIAEDLLQLTGAGRNVVLSARHLGDLGQGLFVDLPSEAASTETATAKTEESAERISVPAVHRRGIASGAEPNRVDADPA